MRWEKVKLGNIAEFSNGVNFDKSAYAPGVKLISVSNFGNRFYPDYSELPEISADVVKENDYLQHGDIIFVRSNGNKELVGRCMLIDNPPTHTTYSGFCIRARVKDTKRFNPKFLTYHFKHDGFRIAIAGNAVGANIQNLSQGRLSAYIAHIPPIETQRRIADILSAYDDLIENNRKQIKLLEEAAQRLYKEWFVDLRFPGHEHTRIVDGVPEGWEYIPLGKIFSYEIGGGWGEDAATEKNDCPGFVIRGTDIDEIKQGDLLSIPYRFHAQGNLASRKLQAGDIIFEVSGGSKNTGIAKTLLITKAILDVWQKPVICASFCKMVRFNEPQIAQYIYDCFQYWRTIGVTQEYEKKSASSIINSRWKDFLGQKCVLLPEKRLLQKYCALSSSFYKQAITNAIVISKATQARDRLLPKLMSGEVEV